MPASRREFLATCAAGAAAALGASAPRTSGLGVIEHSYHLHAADRKARTGHSFRDDPLAFLEFCRERGADGVQIGMGHLDEKAESRFDRIGTEHPGYLEGSLRLPWNRTQQADFRSQIDRFQDAGARVVRTAVLEGRRYETFSSERAFRRFADDAFRALRIAKDVLKSFSVVLAVENHKDFRTAQLVEMVEHLDDEKIGVCVDTGNNLALLEDPMEVVETLAPWAVTTHLKDIAVEPYEGGFRMSEVPFGEGFLDLKRIVAMLRKARPDIHLNIEMITRDPLEIPCLREHYWATFGDVSGRDLVRTLDLVRKHASKQPLPRVSDLSPEEKLRREDENVRRCIAYAGEHLLGG
jgi:sugar phosphate isomerase/epimerase